MNEIEQRLAGIIADVIPIERCRILPAASFRIDLGADRFELISVIVAAEDAFKITIPVAAVDKIKTVGDLVAVIEGKRD